MSEVKLVGYTIIFSTEESQSNIEYAIDKFLADVDAKKQIAQVIELTPEEINKFLTN